MNPRIYLLIFILCVFQINAFAQNSSADDSDSQFWNEIQLTVPLTKKVDFLTQFQTRLTQNISVFNETRLQFGFNFKPHKSWSLNPFYLSVSSRDSRGLFRVEHRFSLRAGYKLPIKSFDATLRGMGEIRHRAPQNSWRFRPSYLLEKNLPTKTKLKIFASQEIFYDSIAERFSRHRVTFGINRILHKNLSVDFWFMRQNDGLVRQGNWNVLATTWRVRL